MEENPRGNDEKMDGWMMTITREGRLCPPLGHVRELSLHSNYNCVVYILSSTMICNLHSLGGGCSCPLHSGTRGRHC